MAPRFKDGDAVVAVRALSRDKSLEDALTWFDLVQRQMGLVGSYSVRVCCFLQRPDRRLRAALPQDRAE